MPGDIPSAIEADVAELVFGKVLRVSDLPHSDKIEVPDRGEPAGGAHHHREGRSGAGGGGGGRGSGAAPAEPEVIKKGKQEAEGEEGAEAAPEKPEKPRRKRRSRVTVGVAGAGRWGRSPRPSGRAKLDGLILDV